MKIAISQLNYHIGNIESNTDKIINEIEKAKQLNIDLIIFSELAICGYSPLDMLEEKSFIERIQYAINDIVIHTKDIAVIVGAPCINKDVDGKKLYNSAYFIDNEQIKNIIHKTLLPTYDIFDEYRYFESGNNSEIIELQGTKIAVTICEDLWDDQPVDHPFGKAKLYKSNPLEHLIDKKPELIVNIAASPFSYNQENKRKNILVRNAVKYNLPLIYVNQVGANTDVIFDGASKILNNNGEVISQLNSFEEDFLEFDTAKFNESAYSSVFRKAKIENIYHALVLGVKDYFQKSGFSKVVLGLSGGLDSAVVSVIAAHALGAENVMNILMPSEFSSDHSISDAKQLVENLKMPHLIIPINNSYNAVKTELNPIFKDLPFNVAEENIQARLRGLLLMAYSNKFGNVVLNTSNKSEAAVGYSTLYGDMNGGLSVIGDVYKTDVYELAKFINANTEIIPENIINKPPSAELRPDQKDSDSLPDYDVLDKILFEYIELKQSVKEIVDKGFKAKTVKKVIQLVNYSEYKRYQFPPILRVSSKSFGVGRRYPIVAKY